MANGTKKYRGLWIVAILSVVFVASLFTLRHFLSKNFQGIVHDFVVKESKGEYQFQTSRIEFNFFKKEVVLYDCILLNIDTITHTYQYSITIKELRVSIASFRQVIFSKFLVIKSIVCKRPEIQLLEASKNTESKPAIHSMGNLYFAIKKVLEDLQVNDCEIQDALLAIRTDENNPRLLRFKPAQFSVRNFSRNNQDKTDKFLFTENITLRSGLQDIVTLDSLHEYSFSRFSFSTKEKSISLDSCTIRGKQADSVSGSYQVFFKRLDLYNFDFNALYAGKLKIDSVHCYDPDIKLFLNMQPQEKEESKKYSTEESLKRLVKKMFGDASFGYIGFSDANIHVTVNNNGDTTIFDAPANNFGVRNLRVDPTNDSPIQFGTIDFAVKNYSSHSADRLYVVSFDSIWLKNNNLFVNNFRLKPDRNLNPNGDRDISVPQLELKGISTSNLILTRKIFADEAILKNASIRLNANKNTTGAKRKSIKEVFALLRENISMKKLRLENAKVNFTASNGKEIEFDNLSSTLSVDKLLNSSEINAVEKAMERISFSKGSIHSTRSDIILTEGVIDGPTNTWTVREIFLKNPKMTANGKNVRFSNILIDEEGEKDEFLVDTISWQSGKLTFDLQGTDTNSSAKPRKPRFNIDIRKINLANTELTVTLKNGSRLYALLNSVEGYDFIKPIEGEMTLNRFTIKGHSLSLSGNDQQLSVDNFLVNDNKLSSIEGIKFNSRKNGDTILANISAIDFIPVLPEKLNAAKLTFKGIIVNHPDIFARLASDHVRKEDNKKKKLLLTINSLTLDKPKLDLAIAKNSRRMYFSTKSSDVSLSNLIWDAQSGKIQTGTTNLVLQDFIFSRNDSLQLRSNRGKIELALKDASFEGKKWETNISLLDLEDVNINMLSKKKGNEMSFKDIDVNIQDLDLNDSLIKDPKRVFMTTPNITVDHINTEFNLSTFHLVCKGGKYTNHNSTFQLDSILMIPNSSKDSFVARQKYQKDYLTLKTGKVIIHRINPVRKADDSVFRAGKIEINDPVLTVYKDKRLPVQMDIVKPMPVNLVKKIESAMITDSIQFKNATVTYTEYNNKSNKEGIVHVTSGNGLIKNIRNRELTHLDSIAMNLSAFIEDSAFVRVIFRESYTDTLAAGILILRVRPFDLTRLNSFLEPIASAKIRSGYLDTLHLRAVAREYISLGEARMVYNNLKIDILSKEDAENKTKAKKVMSFIANLFVKSENKTRTGTIFAERSREKFIINYWIKILLSGISTNVGIKTNKKAMKKYKRQVKKLNVPEIEN